MHECMCVGVGVSVGGGGGSSNTNQHFTVMQYSKGHGKRHCCWIVLSVHAFVVIFHGVSTLILWSFCLDHTHLWKVVLNVACLSQMLAKCRIQNQMVEAKYQYVKYDFDPHHRDKYKFKVHQHYCLHMREMDGCFVCCSMLYQTGVQDEVRSRYDVCMIIGYMHEKRRCTSQMCIRHTKSRALTNSPST